MKFIDLFAGLGRFHLALTRLGHTCVFASEIDEGLADLYKQNFGRKPEGDIKNSRDRLTRGCPQSLSFPLAFRRSIGIAKAKYPTSADA